MRTAARLTLAIVVIMTAAVVLPRPVGRVIGSEAWAQIGLPSPDLTDLLPGRGGRGGGGGDESPSPEPTGGGGGGGSGSGGGGSGGGDGGSTGSDGGSGSGSGDAGSGDTAGDQKGTGRGGDGSRSGSKPVPTGRYLRIPGSFNTDELLAVSAQLRSLGWTHEQVVGKVFVPFIIAGSANWIDTWGAPRYGPGPLIRSHEGQDVFCKYGDPVLAAESGWVDFGNGGLGGRVARVHRPDGGYWYYAHLSDWNLQEFSPGERVQAGDVIGYCGNSGNAIATAPHVHFGWYAPNGEARNPMKQLVGWLGAADRHAARVLVAATGKRVKQKEELTLARQFGDGFLPDLSELRVSGSSLVASGSNPTTGAFSLAEVALQAALSQPTTSTALGEPSVSAGAGDLGVGLVDSESQLGQLLEDQEGLEVSESSD